MRKAPKKDYLESTLEELEFRRWGNTPHDATTLVRTAYELRKKKLKDYTAEDLRIMIGQRKSLEYLIPVAIDFLHQDPFVEGDYYEGDLLQNVLLCPCEFWRQYPKYSEDMKRVIMVAKNQIGIIDLDDEIKEKVEKVIEKFEQCVK